MDCFGRRLKKFWHNAGNMEVHVSAMNLASSGIQRKMLLSIRA